MNQDPLPGTRLGRAVAQQAAAHTGSSGIVPLTDGRDAFAARMMLADAAERTLDVQYYAWRNDLSGTLLVDALVRAADRGVHVRLLLDDNNGGELDLLLAALAAHPNFEVRLFNPFNRRRWRLVDYLARFARLNRRMHNKSFTADGVATIVGGRNIGDEYFDAHQDVAFVDLDVLAIGPVAEETQRDFERYWHCRLARPAQRVLERAAEPAAIAALAETVAARADSAAGAAYAAAIAQLPCVSLLLAGTLAPVWAPTRLVSDDPEKIRRWVPRDELLWPRIRRVITAATRELQLISPYFVPGWTGAAYFRALARRGVRITILTNSLAATDVAAVHTGYAKRRRSLLRAGIELFEMKRAAPRAAGRRRRWFRGSGSSVHAKTFVVDRTHLFIGSFNFDPRSARLNTELGFIIESPTLAAPIADAFAVDVPQDAYRLRLHDGALQWVEQLQGRELVHDQEPASTFWRRVLVTVLSLLPLERQL